ncbi:ACT domain-containing protein ACR9-like protein [Tanacetum coccineum]|uniref:ACT domain-containing protein ACR9-like protein n=1 Tax=Tanacetum coccineum TaxID=301880 RepID=A0ABQ5DN59_9ASTR
MPTVTTGRCLVVTVALQRERTTAAAVELAPHTEREQQKEKGEKTDVHYVVLDVILDLQREVEDDALNPCIQYVQLDEWGMKAWLKFKQKDAVAKITAHGGIMYQIDKKIITRLSKGLALFCLLSRPSTSRSGDVEVSFSATELGVRSRHIGLHLYHGLFKVTLEATVTNKGALALYGRLGVIRAKRLFIYYLTGVDAFSLKLLFPHPELPSSDVYCWTNSAVLGESCTSVDNREAPYKNDSGVPPISSLSQPTAAAELFGTMFLSEKEERSHALSPDVKKLMRASVMIDNSLSPAHSLLQINCVNHKGFLHDIMWIWKDYDIHVTIEPPLQHLINIELQYLNRSVG